MVVEKIDLETLKSSLDKIGTNYGIGHLSPFEYAKKENLKDALLLIVSLVGGNWEIAFFYPKTLVIIRTIPGKAKVYRYEYLWKKDVKFSEATRKGVEVFLYSSNESFMLQTKDYDESITVQQLINKLRGQNG